MSEPLDRDLISARSGGRIGSRVAVFRETGSTNDIVLRAAEGGEPEGYVAFAEKQTMGRGQFGRKWSSAEGLGLWFSILLRPKWPPEWLAEMTPLVAVAVAEALAAACGLAARIKPPNDILCGRRKLAGILSEARTGREVFVVVGIGINVNHDRADFPLELQESATSIAIETQARVPREPVAVAVLNALNLLYDPARPPERRIKTSYAALSRAADCGSFPP